jgi:hypothetical protein
MKKIVLKLAILVGFLTVFPSAAQAQNYTITRWTMDGGGGTSSGGGYTLSGTIGQPDIGFMSGGGYTLAGGFWGLEPLHMIYLPLIPRN